MTASEILAGRWVNMDPRPDWFHAIDFTERDGALMIRPESVSEPLDWGSRAVDLYRFKPGEPAFDASFSLEGLEAELTAYTNKGLIVLASYLAFPEEPDRNYLCRDFFVPDHGERPTPSDQPQGTPADLLGTWLNTEPDTTSIGQVVIRAENDRLFLRVFGSFYDGSRDWGEIAIAPTLADHDQTGFFTRYRFDDVTYELAANCKLGVLVILCCVSFRDGSGRPDYMARSFFRQAVEGGRP